MCKVMRDRRSLYTPKFIIIIFFELGVWSVKIYESCSKSSSKKKCGFHLSWKQRSEFFLPVQNCFPDPILFESVLNKSSLLKRQQK